MIFVRCDDKIFKYISVDDFKKDYLGLKRNYEVVGVYGADNINKLLFIHPELKRMKYYEQNT